jgi:hypothetical protein|tara:strand:+ start:548 stop:808 length:261 start_codon:yes stop_codon:yes gene_type:complete
MKKFRTLGELQKHVNTLTQRKGVKAPVAVWMITGDDILTEDDNLREVPVTDTEAKLILDEINLSDHDYVVDTILNVVDNELSSRGL